MDAQIRCNGCGYMIPLGDEEVKCPHCNTISAGRAQLPVEGNYIERLNIAAGYRRVGRFDDAQQELENLLEEKPDFPVAMFYCFLNEYEVTGFSFQEDDRVKCKCLSSARRPVEENKDWQMARAGATGLQKKQWEALSGKIELLRKKNVRFKENIPKYRAILICDYADESSVEAADRCYSILSKKTDIFYPKETLKKISPLNVRERYLALALKNPEIAPLMFVVYSESLGYRNNARYYNNVAKQCRDFASVHTKNELYSVYCDVEPSPLMKRFSIKNIKCGGFDEERYPKIADKMLERILEGAYTYDEYTKYKNGDGKIMLNGDRGFSPQVEPLSES